MRFFRSTFAGDRRGSVSVISAYFFIVLSSASALTIQGSDMYVTKLQGQRTADLATLAAAATTSPIVSGSPSAMATATALNVATINGFGFSTVATTATNGGTTLNTTITTAEEMYLSQLVSTVSSLTVLSDATVKPATPLTQGCVAALTGAVQIFNSGSVSGSSCDVIADTDLEVSSSSLSVAHVGVGVTKAAEASSLGSPTSLSPTTAKFLYNATLTNPLASNTAVAAIKSHLSAMSTWPYVTSSPVQVSSPTVTSSSNNLYFSSGNNTVPNGHYGTLTIQDVTSVTFQGSGSADPTCSNPTTFSGATYLYNGVNFTATFNSGCYIFKGDFTNYWAHSIYGVAAPGASLTFIFEGSIVNAGGGGIQFPAGTFSIATNIDNTGGNWITLGDGSKVIGGTINNGHNTMNLGNGPFYLLGTSVTQRIGTLTFGNGPFYIWNCTISNTSSGTMIFGTGPYYFYNSTLNSGVSDGGYPLTTLAGGPYYFYSGSLTTGSNSTTKVGPGNIDMYGGNISLVGEYQSFGWGGTPSTGTMQISLNGGTFTHSEGTLVAQGVTIAQASNDMYIFGSAIDIEAPTATSPSYGAQNIAIINLAGNINLGQNGGTAETIGGVLYAPNSTINIYQSQNMRAPSSGCLEAVGGTVNVFNSAGINAAPCSGLTISATGGMPVLQ